MPNFATVFVAVFLLVFALAAAPGAHGLASTRAWVRTQTLRDDVGQASYNYSDAASSLGDLLAVASTSANRGRGEVKIFRDVGNGLQWLATVSDPSGKIGDLYGASVLLFNYRGFKQLAVAATRKGSTRGTTGTPTGQVLLYQMSVSNSSIWTNIGTLAPPSGVYVDNFGRAMFYDGVQLLVSAVRIYSSGPRFELSSVNIIGTAKFRQSDGVQATIDGDPILVYRSVADRGNTTFLDFYSIISDADYTLDVGASIAISGNTMAVGASFREQLKYGSGSDGDLIVESGTVKLLDGSASYSFNNVYIQSGGVLKTDVYDSIRGIGGVLTMKVKNLLHIEPGGSINMTAAGYLGGETAFIDRGAPKSGEFIGGGVGARSQYVGTFACLYNSRLSTGIGASSTGLTSADSLNSSLPFAEANGGGGGYGTRGADGTAVACGDSGTGGQTYGDELLTVLYRGSGGGAGFPYTVGAGGAGGNGGGIINIAAKRIINYGTIDASGGNGGDGGFFSGGGGGGSGGSIVLLTNNLANYGAILAKGGRGGVRAKSSGSGGDEGVTGGHGGDGRIRFDALQTQAHGIVVPRPKNVTTYLGEVLLYRRDASTLDWTLYAQVARIPEYQFIGHQVALSGNLLAIASDQGTPVDPFQQIFLVDISTIENSTSPYSWRAINHPNPKDLGYGYVMAFDNNTLVVGAAGSNEVRGVVYVYQSPHLFTDLNPRLTTLTSQMPTPGDFYGNYFVFDFPRLYVQLPLGLDEPNLPPNPSRRSIGGLTVFKFVRNVSAAHSSVSCDFTVVTPNVTLNCTVHLLASDGYVAGDINEIPFIHPPVDFRSVGVFTFQVTPRTPGTHPIHVTWKQHALQSVVVTATAHIDPDHSNATCAGPNGATVYAGDTVECVIRVSRGAGEAIAAKEFDVSVWNLEDEMLAVNGFVTAVPDAGPAGVNLRTLPSSVLQTVPAVTNFPTVLPTVEFVRHGVYRFSFVAARSGTWAAFAMYQRRPLRFPNPSVISVVNPPAAGSASVLECPPVVRPNRTFACTLFLASSSGAPTGDEAFAATLSSPAVVSAGMATGGDAGATFPTVGVYAQENRYSLLVYPNISETGSGFLKINVTVAGQVVAMRPDVGVNISATAPVECVPMPRLHNSFTLYNQWAAAYRDASLHGISATSVWYDSGVGFCDEPKA